MRRSRWKPSSACTLTEAVAASPLQADLQGVLDCVDARVWEALRGRSIFVTGGTGFVGSWLVEALLQARKNHAPGLSVTVLSRDPGVFLGAYPQLAADAALRLHRGDLASFSFPNGRFDLAVHAALPVAEAAAGGLAAIARQGAQRVVEFAQAQALGLQGLLHVSSGAVYGRQPAGLARLREDTPWDLAGPGNDYTQAKRLEEQVFRESRVGCVTARCFALIGPRLSPASGTAAAQFIAQAAAGHTVTVEGDGLALRSYQYAADMAAWLLTLLALGQPRRAYNVGSEETIGMADLARKVSDRAGGGPVQVLGRSAPGRAGTRYIPDTVRARDELGLRNCVSLDDAIARTLRWRRSQPLTMAP